MAKKMFFRPKLSKGKAWIIDCAVHAGDSEKRVRKQFNLNDITDLAVRELVAEGICDFLSSFNPYDFLPETSEKSQLPTVAERIAEVLEYKNSYERINTSETYAGAIKKFMDWAKPQRLDRLPIDQFGKKQGSAYIKYLRSETFVRGGVRKKYSARTVNNHLTLIRTVFSEMLADYDNLPNPFAAEKKMRVVGKNRRAFTDGERVAVAKYIRDNDYWLFRGVLLQYFCYIRPKEISSLRFRDFDLGKGLVKVSVYEAKTWKERFATIPEAVLPYFRDGIFDKQPGNYYLFGRVGDGSRRAEHKMAPAKVPARVDRPYKKHLAYLKKMQRVGLLGDIEGLCWYSWKDTGITKHLSATTPLATRDQAGHSDMDMTLVYYEAAKVNEEYRMLPNDLL